MKKIIISICILSLSVSAIFAQNSRLSEIDALVSFFDTDLSAEYTIVSKEPGGAGSKTVAAMFRRDSENVFSILVLEPSSEKGKGYLKEQEVLWLYDPEDKSFTSTSAKNRFQNSTIRLSDFNPIQYEKNYRIDSQYEEKLGKFDCTVFELTAKNTSVTYEKTKIWVSDDNLVRKIEDYSLSGQLMRTTAIPTYQKIEDRWIAKTLVIQDNLMYKVINNKREYARTTITIANPSLEELPNIVYTKEYLQRAR